MQKGLDVVGAGAQGRAVGGIQKEPGGSPAQQVGATSRAGDPVEEQNLGGAFRSEAGHAGPSPGHPRT